jgi:hypothetical protein
MPNTILIIRCISLVSACYFVGLHISRISAYVTLDVDICMLAQGSSLFKLVKITMATVDSQVRSSSAISSCSYREVD